MSLSSIEKQKFLRALEEDREFRYAVMGLIGFRELLERFARLEERQQRLEEEFKKLEERFARIEERQQRLEEEFKKLYERQLKLEEEFKKLEERFARLEERQQRLEERYQRLEERFAELEERVARLEERFAQLEERFVRLEERVTRLEERMTRVEEILVKHGELLDALFKEVKKLKANVGALGRRFGKGFEALLREAYSDLLRNIGVEEYEVQHFKYIDIDGKYLASGTVIEVDIVVKNKRLWLLELKSNVEEKDVAWFHVVSQVAERVLGRRADRKIILGVVVDKEAYEYARKLGLEVVYVSLVED